MLYKSILLGSASGSTAGVTASRNRYGAYLRARVVPVNPNTSPQQAVKAAMTQLVSRWLGVLTAAQRQGWETYAANVPVTNPLGDQINLTGQTMYIRSNVQRLRADPAQIVDDAPTIFNLGDFSPVTVGITVSTGAMVVGFTTGDEWVSEDDAFLFVFVARPVNPTRNFFAGPWLYTGTAVAGDSVTPPTSPASIGTYPHGPLTVDQRVSVRAVVARADGRYSGSQQHLATLA